LKLCVWCAGGDYIYIAQGEGRGHCVAKRVLGGLMARKIGDVMTPVELLQKQHLAGKTIVHLPLFAVKLYHACKRRTRMII
jgi:hypothetical protein